MLLSFICVFIAVCCLKLQFATSASISTSVCTLRSIQTSHSMHGLLHYLGFVRCCTDHYLVSILKIISAKMTSLVKINLICYGSYI